MKVVLTTVDQASVSINGKDVGKIARGFLLLVGFTYGDNEELASNIANFDLDKYFINIKKHHQEEGSFDKGDACRNIIDLIRS